MTKQPFITAFVLLTFSFLFPNPVSAALVRVDRTGVSYLTVLGDNSQIALTVPKKNVEVKNVASLNGPLEDARISLSRDGDSLKLQLKSSKGTMDTDVTEFKDDLVELEERGDTRKLIIASDGEGFQMIQNGFIAQTEYPIEIDAKSSQLSVISSTGIRHLSILPYEAVEQVIRANIMNDIGEDKGYLTLSEGEKGELQYELRGTKHFNLFKLYSLKLPVKVNISASTGQVLTIDAPVWYKILGILQV